MTNLGAHSIDIAQWVMNVNGPSAVTSTGGRFVLEDDGETPDTQDALLEYPGFTAVWSHREGAAGRRDPKGTFEFCGTKGSLSISRAGFEITPDMKIDPASAIPQFRGHTAGGPERSTEPPKPYIEPMKETGSGQEQFDLHVRNFLDCIKTRQRPIAYVEDGHRVASTCHLSHLSLRVGRKLRWDVAKEQIVGDADANKMLTRPY